MQEWIRNLGNPKAQSGGAKRDDDDENRQPSGRSARVEDVGLFRRECGCGDDDPVKREQRQSLAVENGQNFVERLYDLPSIGRVKLRPGGMQKLDLLQDVTVHVASRSLLPDGRAEVSALAPIFPRDEGERHVAALMPMKAKRYLASASAPTLATWESCDDSAPETPMAPTILPSTTIGKPPSSGVMSFTARRRSPAPPAAMASSSALLGRLKVSAVRALPSDAPMAASWALSPLWNITRLPPLSRMVMATCKEFFVASSSAAAIARLASSSVIAGP